MTHSNNAPLTTGGSLPENLRFLETYLSGTVVVADLAKQDAQSAKDAAAVTRLTRVLGLLRAMACNANVALDLLENS